LQFINFGHIFAFSNLFSPLSILSFPIKIVAFLPDCCHRFCDCCRPSPCCRLFPHCCLQRFAAIGWLPNLINGLPYP